MFLKVLGAGAGGGLPQWNCGCRNCSDARDGKLPQMTQSSVAVSATDVDWVILNTSPDIRAQLAATPALHPKSLRGSPITATILSNGDVDHIAGLLTLREKTPFTVYATKGILDILDENGIFRVLDKDLVAKKPISLDQEFDVAGLSITPFAVPGKIALFNEGADVNTNEMGEQTIGLRIAANGKVLNYIPGCACLPDWLVDQIDQGDMLLFDGTVWENEEMPKTGTGQKTGARMGHISMTGPDGSLARLADIRCKKIYIHINNTNPVLQPQGPQRAEVTAAGWDIAQDGMEVSL